MKYFTWTAHRGDPEKMGWFRLFLFVLEGQFVLSTVFGWIVLEAIVREIRRKGYEGDIELLDGGVLGATAACAVACAVVAFLIHWLRIRKARKRGATGSELRTLWRVGRMAAVVGALCGLLSVLYFLYPWTMFPLLLVSFILVWIYVRAFLRRATELLRPGNYGAWSDVAQLLFVYVTLVVMFSMVALVLQHGAELLSDLPKKEIAYPFGEGQIVTVLDALYFSIVVMTTLGFGDITPKVPIAQIVVIVQTVVGYVLFGLMIGILTRGILPRDEDSP